MITITILPSKGKRKTQEQLKKETQNRYRKFMRKMNATKNTDALKEMEIHRKALIHAMVRYRVPIPNIKTVILFIALLFTSASAIPQDFERCTAIAKSTGKQCKKPATTGQKTCSIHDPKAYRCGAPKTKGGTCNTLVKKKDEKCRWHKD